MITGKISTERIYSLSCATLFTVSVQLIFVFSASAPTNTSLSIDHTIFNGLKTASSHNNYAGSSSIYTIHLADLLQVCSIINYQVKTPGSLPPLETSYVSSGILYENNVSEDITVTQTRRITSVRPATLSIHFVQIEVIERKPIANSSYRLTQA